MQYRNSEEKSQTFVDDFEQHIEYPTPVEKALSTVFDSTIDRRFNGA